MKKIIIQLSLICCLSFVAVGVSAQQAKTNFSLLAPGATEQIDAWSDDTAEMTYNPQTDKTTMTQIVASVLKVFFGLLATIFIILIILAGYNWMTAGGNEEKVSKANNLISRSIIGLLIIVAAYAITYWIFARLPY